MKATGGGVILIGSLIVGAALILAPATGSQVVRVDDSAVSESTWQCLRSQGLVGRPFDGPLGTEVEALYPTRDQLHKCWYFA